MLGVSVETLRRWEAEGRMRMERSDGDQRMVEIAEVTRLLDERRKATADRPIVAQSARNRFAGIVTRIEKDRVAAVVEVIAGPPSPRQPHDGRGRRRARPRGRGRGGLRRQGDQRDRRDPVRQGVARREASASASWLSSRCCVVAACSGGGGAVGAAAPPPRRATAAPASAAAELTIYGAASLKGALAKAQDGLRGGQPGHDADDLDRLVGRPRDPDRAGRARRRLPVGRHHEPQEARRRRARRRAARSSSPATS